MVGPADQSETCRYCPKFVGYLDHIWEQCYVNSHLITERQGDIAEMVKSGLLRPGSKTSLRIPPSRITDGLSCLQCTRKRKSYWYHPCRSSETSRTSRGLQELNRSKTSRPVHGPLWICHNTLWNFQELYSTIKEHGLLRVKRAWWKQALEDANHISMEVVRKATVLWDHWNTAPTHFIFPPPNLNEFSLQGRWTRISLVVPLGVWSRRATLGGGDGDYQINLVVTFIAQKQFETNAWPRVCSPFLTAFASGVASDPDRTLIESFTETSRSS